MFFVVSSVVGALALSPDMALIVGNKSGLEFHQLIFLVFISGSVLIDYGLDLDLSLLLMFLPLQLLCK